MWRGSVASSTGSSARAQVEVSSSGSCGWYAPSPSVSAGCRCVRRLSWGANHDGSDLRAAHIEMNLSASDVHGMWKRTCPRHVFGVTLEASGASVMFCCRPDGRRTLRQRAPAWVGVVGGRDA